MFFNLSSLKEDDPNSTWWPVTTNSSSGGLSRWGSSFQSSLALRIWGPRGWRAPVCPCSTQCCKPRGRWIRWERVRTDPPRWNMLNCRPTNGSVWTATVIYFHNMQEWWRMTIILWILGVCPIFRQIHIPIMSPEIRDVGAFITPCVSGSSPPCSPGDLCRHVAPSWSHSS